jgi:hypothetical protein
MSAFFPQATRADIDIKNRANLIDVLLGFQKVKAVCGAAPILTPTYPGLETRCTSRDLKSSFKSSLKSLKSLKRGSID